MQSTQIDNPMLSAWAGLASSDPVDGHYPTSNYTDSDAQADAMRHVDQLQDWLGGELANADVAPLVPHTKPEAFRPESLPLGTLLAMAFDLGQPAQTRLAALDEIRERYLNSDMGKRVTALCILAADEDLAEAA